MKNPLKRVKRLIQLSKKDPKAVDMLLDEHVDAIHEAEAEPDGVFISMGTQKDWEEQEREDKGMKGIFGL